MVRDSKTVTTEGRGDRGSAYRRRGLVVSEEESVSAIMDPTSTALDISSDSRHRFYSHVITRIKKLRQVRHAKECN